MRSAIPAPRILAMAVAVPRFVSANDLPSMSKFVAATGVKMRRIAKLGMDFTDYAVSASAAAVARSGVSANQIDAVISITQTPPQLTPGVAPRLQAALGLRRDVAAFDVNLGCSGYPYGLWMAAQMIASRDARRVLLVVGDLSSKIVDPEDPATGALFGDAVSATVLDGDDPDDCWRFIFGTDGSRANALTCNHGDTLRMDGGAVFSFALVEVPALYKQLVDFAGVSIDQPYYVLMHQANRMIIGNLTRKIGLDPQEVPINIDRWGNTSSASIPLLMCDPELEVSAGLVDDRKHSTRVVMMGFGVGLSWAGMIGRVRPIRSVEVLEL